MKCNYCHSQMNKAVDGAEVHHKVSYNLYHCSCGTVAKEHLTGTMATTWVYPQNNIETDRVCNIKISDREYDRDNDPMAGWRMVEAANA